MGLIKVIWEPFKGQVYQSLVWEVNFESMKQKIIV